jgi:TadE-like protein
MHSPQSSSAKTKKYRSWNLLRRFRLNDEGTTAIEFGFVALPFLMFVFGIIAVGLKYFTENSLEHAVETVSRQVRTCQAQSADMTVEQFRTAMCNQSSGYIPCNAKFVVHVQTIEPEADGSAFVPQSCLDAGGDLAAAASSNDDALEDYSGGAGTDVLVTACHEWETAQLFSWLNFGSMSNGSELIQAVTAFRVEPCD